MKGLLFTSFGTSYQNAREKHIDSVADYIAAALPEYKLEQAYTSGIVRKILEERGIIVPDVSGGLKALAEAGVTEVMVQPSHLLPGMEYDKMCRQAEECRGMFQSLTIADPLIASTDDLDKLAEVLAAYYPRAEGSAVVLMGHGTPQFANLAYAALDYHFKEKGRDDIYVGAVEAFPELENVLSYVKRTSYDRIVLAPLMLVAGDHATNDMAGDDDDSWAQQFRAAGYRVETHLVGLGEIPQIQELYLERVRRALTNGF